MGVRVVPELTVGSVEEAQRWYVDVLGALAVWRFRERFGAVRVGDAELYLVDDPERGPAYCYLHVRDVDALHSRVTSVLSGGTRGEVVDRLRNRSWAMREFTLVDPWGNTLRIGHPIGTVGQGPGYRSTDDASDTDLEGVNAF